MALRNLKALIVPRYLRILSRSRMLEALTVYKRMTLRILRTLIVLRYLEILSGPRVLEALTVYRKGWPLGSLGPL